jgi:hypothetical protein
MRLTKHVMLDALLTDEDHRLIEQHEYAISVGRRLFELGAPKSACLDEDEIAGWQQAEEDVYAAGMAAADGTLQQMIDAAAELEDQIEGRLDDEWHSRGQW